MPGKTPRSNGKQPTENGSVRGNKDADNKAKGKKTADKDGDEEMTVVVPPSKNAKQSGAPPPADADGDVSMGGEEDKTAEGEVKVDPVTQAITGKCNFARRSHYTLYWRLGSCHDISVYDGLVLTLDRLEL